MEVGGQYGHQAWIYVTPIAFPNAMLAVNFPVCKDGTRAHELTLKAQFFSHTYYYIFILCMDF